MKKRLIGIGLALWIGTMEAQVAQLYVFVGEKISVEAFEPELEEGTILMDEAFIARYKVLENVYGELTEDTIEFQVFDHFGQPEFSNYTHVLLYVIKEDSQYFHERYLHSPLYKTQQGEWASTYFAYDHEHPYRTNRSIVPQKIDFEPEVVFDLSSYTQQAIEASFPAPYFVIRGDQAVAVYGNYLHELFELKKDGVLKARGYTFD